MTLPDTQQNFSLKNYNTFHLEVRARRFVSVSSVEQLREVLALNRGENIMLLGGGSNLLLTQQVDALVIHLNIKGRKIITEEGDSVIVEAMAGENWHEFVMWTLDQGFGGLENLSLIPGNVGTAPMQNIGAYGVEIKDVMESCTGLNLETLEMRDFSTQECAFGYRESIFKTTLKGKYAICAVRFKLNRQNPKLRTGYGDILAELENAGITSPSPADISNAVINIRRRKLPDPAVLGNSGSFFKNPVVPDAVFESAREKFPDMPHYAMGDGLVKIPAGWLIERAGFKGKRFGDAGVHEKQALVLVNHGSATGEEILNLAAAIQREVREIFGIQITPEVNII